MQYLEAPHAISRGSTCNISRLHMQYLEAPHSISRGSTCNILRLHIQYLEAPHSISRGSTCRVSYRIFSVGGRSLWGTATAWDNCWLDTMQLSMQARHAMLG